ESLLIADLTIRDNLLLIRNDAAKIDTVMRRLGVSDLYDKYPDELSGGERQRIAVVRALIVGAKILLADEPTASLDEANSVEIAALLSELRNEGCTVIVATHEHYFNELADEILHLDYGKLEHVEVLSESLEEKNWTEGSGRKTGDNKKKTLVKRKGFSEKRLKKGENLSLLRIVFVRGKKHWKLSALLPTMLLVLLILLFSTVTKQSDAILLGYLEHYYPEALFSVNEKIMERLPENFKEKMTVYYPYMAQENGVKAFYYAAQEDSILAVKGMLKYGSFPESPEEIIVSYEFAQERIGLIRSAEDIIGKSYTFLGREFVIAGCMHSFEEDIDIGFFFSAEGMFDSDAVYRRFRGSMIFVDYEVMIEIGELGETY
ncbi:MAG: ATP-binding cassette domain-containing protein, partial [Lachnospiraceae bacterium]|nr:ATP-binding cassette domain-containing protein [Lachnospiraceae bacterium]